MMACSNLHYTNSTLDLLKKKKKNIKIPMPLVFSIF